MEFRLLRADEIEVRVGNVSKTSGGVTLLLYKDARCDMAILDETLGTFGWQRHHSRDNANCVVSIWDSEKKMWIEKEDVGTESNTEAQKGLASDSFKRACFNVGIGRELYTTPFIYLNAGEFKEKFEKYHCTDIKYDGRKIESVTIYVESTKKEHTFTNKKVKAKSKSTVSVNKMETPVSKEEDEYNYAKAKVDKYMDKSPIDADTEKKIISELKRTGQDEATFLKFYKISKWSELDVMRAEKLLEQLATKPNKE